jgi:enolase
MRINNISSRVILNSQGRKTVECTLTLDNGKGGTFAPPAGTSVGKYEAKTVSAEVSLDQIEKIAPEVKKLGNSDQNTLDEFLNKHNKLGANTTLSISIAFAIAANSLYIKSQAFNKSLKPGFKKPKLMVLFFEGGVHASNKVSFQEFMGVYEDIFKAAKDYHQMKTLLEKEGHFINCGMEGALVSEKLTDEIIFMLMKGKKVALDLGGSYRKQSQIDVIEIPEKYNIVSIEDHYPEDDTDKWRKFYNRWHDKVLIVGDDLTVTNKDRIKKFANNAINAVIIKPNQQRTLTDTLEAVKAARDKGLKIIVSHRSGETNQTFVSDLAVAIGADYVKFGAPVRGERVVKYNKLLKLIKT